MTDPEDAAPEVSPEALAYLESQQTLTLATASSGGLPHAATLLYASDGLTLYVWTRPDSVTAQHIDQNPAVSFTVDQYTADWTQTKGIQGEGEARQILDAAQIEHAVQRFGTKFPEVGGTQTGHIAFFRIAPTRVQFIDNTSAAPESARGLGSVFQRTEVFNVLRDLPPAEIAGLQARLQTVQVDSGEVIVRQGGPADKFFIIVDGEVEVVREDGGSQQTVATLGPGQFFGEVAVLRDIPRTATVRAVAPTTLLAMPREAFRSLVAQSLSTTQNLDDVIQRRLGELGEGPPHAGDS